MISKDISPYPVKNLQNEQLAWRRQWQQVIKRLRVAIGIPEGTHFVWGWREKDVAAGSYHGGKGAYGNFWK